MKFCMGSAFYEVKSKQHTDTELTQANRSTKETDSLDENWEIRRLKSRLLEEGPDMIFRSPCEDLDFQDAVSYPEFIFERCKKFATKPALIDGLTDQRILFEDIPKLSRRVANFFKKSGLRKGDVVCVFAPNHIYYPIIYFSVLSIGGIITDVNPSFKTEELLRQLKDSGTRFLVTSSHLINIVQNITNDETFVKGIYTIDNSEGYTSIDQILNDPTEVPFPAESSLNPVTSPVDRPLNPLTDPAVLPYSSGTTGLPKGVILTHYNLVANTLQTCHRQCGIYNEGTETLVVLQPFFHMAGKLVAISCGLYCGATLIVSGQFDYQNYLKLNEKYRATFLLLVPPIALRLSKDSELHKHDLSSVRKFGVGSAPIGETVVRELAAKLNVTIVTQGYGLTEGTCVTSSQPQKSWKYSSVGILVPNTTAKIIDIQTGRELGVGEEGEILMKGPQVMLRYHNMPDATAKTIDTEGWLHTGDIGHFDEDNHLYIVDRLKELIKVKGFQVAPAELEALLLTHSRVEDAAVIGVPDERAGEVPAAFVVISAGPAITEQQIQSFVAEKVVPYKQLKGGIYFVASIPKSQSGKILRKELRSKHHYRLSPISKL